MKRLEPPHVPGNTEAERMDAAVRRMFSVSKEDIQKAEKELKRHHPEKKRTKKKLH